MKKVSIVLLSFLLIFSFTACKKESSETEKSVTTRVNESLEKRAKRLEAEKLAQEEQLNSEKREKTFYAYKSPVIFPDKKFNNESAKQLQPKQKIVTANPVFTERERIIDNTEENPKNSEFITKTKLEAIEKQLSVVKDEHSKNNNSSLFEYFRYKKRVQTLSIEKERARKKLEFLVNLREKENRERVITSYRVKTIDGKEETGFVKVSNLVDDLSVFIAKPYKDVDYKEVKKLTFESNPPVKVRGVYVKLPSASQVVWPKKKEKKSKS